MSRLITRMFSYCNLEWSLSTDVAKHWLDYFIDVQFHQGLKLAFEQPNVKTFHPQTALYAEYRDTQFYSTDDAPRSCSFSFRRETHKMHIQSKGKYAYHSRLNTNNTMVYFLIFRYVFNFGITLLQTKSWLKCNCYKQ